MNYADVKKHNKLLADVSRAIDALEDAKNAEEVITEKIDYCQNILTCKENTLKNFLNKHPEFKLKV